MSEANGNGSVASLPVVAEPYRAPAAVPAPLWEPDTEEPGIPLSQYLWILKRHRWRILGSIGICVLAATIFSLRVTPIYESTTTIDIDRRVPAGILGEEATQSALNDADQFMATQMKLIQSDSVLRPIATKYSLRELEKGLSNQASLTNTQQEAPVVLKKLQVTRPPNTYILLINYRSPDRQLSADVANAIAQSYLVHSYNIRYKAAAGLSQFMEKQLEELKAKMERSSTALAQFERDLSVIDPEEKTNIISARLLQLNTEYTSAQADRVKKEAAFASVQSGTMEAAAVSSQGEALKKLTEQLNEAQEKFADAKTRYGANHPEYRKAETQVTEAEHQLEETKNSIGERVEIEYKESLARESMLEKAVTETKGEFDRINAKSFDYRRLKQEAEGDKKIYDELIRKIKEAGINASFQNSSIRIADLARPAYKPVFPNIPLNVALAFFLSGFLAVGVAVVSDALDNTVRDPEQVTRILKTVVVGTLPMIKSMRGQLMPAFRSHNGSQITPLLKQSDQSLTNFDEAIRTLRNSILLTDFDRRLRSLLMTSASPAEGKSTVAAHLALAHAEQGYRTLLIDGDLRRPSVHKFFDVPNNIGLSKVLLFEFPWRDALLRPRENLDFYVLPAGSATRRAADLVGRGLPSLLDEVSQDFDLVIVDAPPLLGFPEPLQMAATVDGVIIVARAGQTNRSAVSTVLNTLTRLRANVVGLVLNQVHREVSPGYYYYHGHYSKYYRQPQK
ncbi:MAG TPA: polysaccharide biosynthesis tyrosine autokinase [Bryobacteraceae bacterium]|jgi:capsular exopolysaccharide synthesis family protein|nr:polysaccharide biosynthesis tyrosine autokinase [Bryobacteraceae bacterium]